MTTVEQSRVWRPYHAGMSDVTRLLRTEVALAFVLACLGGCSDSSSGVDGYEQYLVDWFDLSADQVNDSVDARVVIQVGDSIGGSRIAGAVVRFSVSSGTVVPE